MDFGEKLQELRKKRGMTQEELAEALYVSRTAVSKWESSRGYPSIDSLKEISSFFNVSIDDLLSGEKLLSLAEREHKTSLRRFCDLLLGIADLMSVALIVLPLYPNTVNGYVYSVNLPSYTETSELNRMIYWGFYLALVLLGSIKTVMTQLGLVKGQKAVTGLSLGAGTAAVLFLSLGREAYAAAAAFLLLGLKVMLWYHRRDCC